MKKLLFILLLALSATAYAQSTRLNSDGVMECLAGEGDNIDSRTGEGLKAVKE